MIYAFVKEDLIDEDMADGCIITLNRKNLYFNPERGAKMILQDGEEGPRQLKEQLLIGHMELDYVRADNGAYLTDDHGKRLEHPHSEPLGVRLVNLIITRLEKACREAVHHA